MLYFLVSVLGILFTIFFVIGTHELAHFAAARLFGIKVLRFSIGFGKTLWRWSDKSGTEYVFALIPLGGYVKMLDEGEESEPIPPEDLPKAFNRQPFYKKFLVVLAGPLMNLFCALILYWIIFMIGFTSMRPVIGSVAPTSIAEQANLKPNQEIVSIDNSEPMGWAGVILRLVAHMGDQDTATMVTRPLNETKQTTHVLNLQNWEMGELRPDPLSSIGIIPFKPDVPLIIGYIASDSPAEKAALQIGDKITSVDKVAINSWEQLTEFMEQNPQKQIILTLVRNEKIVEVPLQVGIKKHFFSKPTGYLGIAPKIVIPKELMVEVKYAPLQALPRAAQEMLDFTYFNLLLFFKTITGKMSLQSLGGPITIFQSAGDALNFGLLPFLGFLAFLSVAIGVINLLPIPGLDGGHLLFQIIEAIIGRPIPLNVLTLFYRLGFLLLIVILIQALTNDILRMF